MTEMMVSYSYAGQNLQEQTETISSRLGERFLSKDLTCLLMIDTAILRLRDKESLLCRQISARESICVPVVPQYLSAAFQPKLVPLNLSVMEDRQLLEMSVESAFDEIHPEKIKQGQGRLICGWLSYSTTPENVAVHLGKSAMQEREGKDILLRFYDPAVSLPLWAILDDWQRQRLLGPVTAWYSVDGDGQWVQRTGISSQQIRLSWSLSLSPQNWLDIHFIGIVNRILCEYRNLHLNEMRLSELQVFQSVLPALRRAWQFPFRNPDDLILYGTHALMISPNFDEHAIIVRILQISRVERKNSYREIVADLTEQQWCRIKDECRKTVYDFPQSLTGDV
ncbi:DUF4123 domain-containing protein [Intestinirhabdus alba]|jgi:hypothetical protein|uniref:DUF4123 domain-containing protein n=1 Tax=Intestinirhabdus alba TaxID=2899544 RepID=A0A6L6IPN3_9ENTR|nr:DUF4123 domain-containing protein [Intestinirhabdus alba]MTH48801.1 DUF4123 domain-containing protein [Intestinirhabdus alba]